MSAIINAQSAVNTLLQSDEEQLYIELGVRQKAYSDNLIVGSSFEPGIDYDETQMGPLDFIRDVGRRFFNRIRPMVYDLLCGSDPDSKQQRDKLLKGFGVTDVQATITTAVVGVLITNLGLAAGIAAVVAALVMKLFFKPTYTAFCEALKPKDNQ